MPKYSIFKAVSLLAAAVFLIGLVNSCSLRAQNPVEDDTQTPDKNEINVWAWDDKFNIVAVNEAMKIYQRTHPQVKVNTEVVALNDIMQKLNTGFSSGNYEELPDIFLLEDYKIRNFLLTYPGEILDLSGKIDYGRFMEYKLNVMTVGTAVYGVPFDSGVASLFYRTDYLEQAGYQESDMQNLTWDRYIEIGQDVVEKTGKKMLTMEPGDPAQIRIILQSAGAWYVREDGTINLDQNEPLRQAISVYKKILDSGIALPITDWNSYLTALNQGEIASTPIGCWAASSIQKQPDQKGKWAIAPIPRLGENPQSINASNVGGSSWYVVANKPNAELAADFLASTFASSDDLMNTLVKEINLVSTLKTASDMPNYNLKSEFFSGQEIFKDWAKWTLEIPNVNYGLNTFGIEECVTTALEHVVDGSETMDAALEEAQKEAVNLYQ